MPIDDYSQINSYIKGLNNLKDNLSNIAIEAVEKKKGKLVGDLKLRLYRKGISGSGLPIKPEYDWKTIHIKKQSGQITSHVTLRDSGDLYKSLKLVSHKKKSETDVISNLPYALELIDKYGGSIFDFTKQEVEIIIQSIIDPAIQKELNKLGK